jgi:hypothetical protein
MVPLQMEGLYPAVFTNIRVPASLFGVVLGFLKGSMRPPQQAGALNPNASTRCVGSEGP